MEKGVELRPSRDAVPTAPVLVSIVVPCRNERRNIEETLKSIVAQEQPPGGFEIIVVDGMSDDGTRAILEKFIRECPSVNVMDNPARTTPMALNIGIRASRGSFIVIMGAHACYAPDYIVSCLRLMDEHPESDCVGGPIISRGTTAFGRAVAVAMSHKLGVGNARHRFPDYEGYAEGACFPMFRRRVFETVGLYDEALLRNQDDEFNLRFRRAGGRVFISPSARSVYQVRGTAIALFRQYFQYGRWRAVVLRGHRYPASLRQIVPAAFVITLAAITAAAIFVGNPWRLIGGVLLCAYLATLFGAAALSLNRHGSQTVLMFPAAAMVMHVAYGIGFVGGAVLIALAPRLQRRVPQLHG